MTGKAGSEGGGSGGTCDSLEAGKLADWQRHYLTWQLGGSDSPSGLVAAAAL